MAGIILVIIVGWLAFLLLNALWVIFRWGADSLARDARIIRDLILDFDYSRYKYGVQPFTVAGRQVAAFVVAFALLRERFQGWWDRPIPVVCKLGRHSWTQADTPCESECERCAMKRGHSYRVSGQIKQLETTDVLEGSGGHYRVVGSQSKWVNKRLLTCERCGHQSV